MLSADGSCAATVASTGSSSTQPGRMRLGSMNRLPPPISRPWFSSQISVQRRASSRKLSAMRHRESSGRTLYMR